jgi:methylmalonyl-CoA/ethylmalonyl-CoA epimerase
VTAAADALLRPPFQQCAMVVEDLDESVRRWHRQLGIGPWTAFRYEPPLLKDMRYHGAEVEFSLRHALCWQGEMQFELVQPLGGPSIFADHLASHGPGMHHIGKYVTDHPAAVAQALAAGFEPLQSARGFGAEGDGAFAYFQAPGVEIVIELISAPRVRIEPEFVYPAPSGTVPR